MTDTEILLGNIGVWCEDARSTESCDCDYERAVTLIEAALQINKPAPSPKGREERESDDFRAMILGELDKAFRAGKEMPGAYDPVKRSEVLAARLRTHSRIAPPGA